MSRKLNRMRQSAAGEDLAILSDHWSVERGIAVPVTAGDFIL